MLEQDLERQHVHAMVISERDVHCTWVIVFCFWIKGMHFYMPDNWNSEYQRIISPLIYLLCGW